MMGAERNNSLSWTLNIVSGMVFLTFTKFILVHTWKMGNAYGGMYMHHNTKVMRVGDKLF